jgi:sulfite dehydrogenase (cytochrome) subunit A
MITSPADGYTLHTGQAAKIRGLAWDGGYGIRSIEISADGGATAQLGMMAANVGDRWR